MIERFIAERPEEWNEDIGVDDGTVIVRLGREETLMWSVLLLDLSERLGEAS